MNSLFRTFINAIKSKFYGIYSMARLWMNPVFIKTQVLSKVLIFFQHLVDVKPKSRKDYYTFFSWMVSKKLAYAILVAAAMLSVFVLMALKPIKIDAAGRGTGIKAYKYNSLPLKFQKGAVKILDRDKKLAYSGEVESGTVTGSGKLYGKKGNLIYEGTFENNMFEGEGTLYYPQGGQAYSGSFSQNKYQGKGNTYWENGNPEYIGNFLSGLKSGAGILYNSSGDQIFKGAFSGDQLVYSQLLGKTTGEAGAMYTGRTVSYNDGELMYADLPEIQALYLAEDGSGSLDTEWKLLKVYVLEDSLKLGERFYQSINHIKEVFGQPEYQGYTNMKAGEAVCINHLREMGHVEFADTGLVSGQRFTDVYDIESYNRAYDLYIYTFRHENLVYSFYSDKKNDTFAMYSIENVS